MHVEQPRPLTTLSYTLSFADALAYESVSRELRGWRKLAFFVWIALAGAAVALLPDGWTAGESDWRFWLYSLGFAAFLYLIAMLVINLGNRRRAHRRLPHSLDMLVEQWGDHLAITQDAKIRFLPFETIAGVGLGTDHAFIRDGAEVLIIPRRAFAEPMEMEAFAAFLDGFGHQD